MSVSISISTSTSISISVSVYGISLYSNCLFLYFLCILTVNYFVRFSAISARGTRCPQIEARNPKSEMSKICLF